MYFSDDHVHSTYSFDGNDSVEAIARRAQEIGLQEVCLTEHIEPHHPDPACDMPPVFEAWLGEIDRVQALIPEVKLRRGIEIGDNAPFREEIYATLRALPLDYHLLSLHLVDNLDPYDHKAFFAGRGRDEAYRRYVEVQLESVLHFTDYDALAHLGYCGKFAPFSREECPLRWRDAPDHLDVLLRTMAEQGKALEINTSGLKRTDSPIPGWDILRRFRELGGEFVTLGSDAHRAEDLTYCFGEALRIAIYAGFRWGVVFEQRQRKPYALEESVCP